MASILIFGVGCDDALALALSTAFGPAISFNRPGKRWLDRITLSEARQLLAQGHFPSGSMGPKIEAVISFLEPGGERRAIVTNPPNLGRAVSGAAGTHIIAK